MRELNTPVVRGSEHPGGEVSEAQECGDRQRPARLTKAAREKPLSGLAPEVFVSAVAQLCVMIRRSVRTPGSHWKVRVCAAPNQTQRSQHEEERDAARSQSSLPSSLKTGHPQIASNVDEHGQARRLHPRAEEIGKLRCGNLVVDDLIGWGGLVAKAGWPIRKGRGGAELPTVGASADLAPGRLRRRLRY